MKDFEEVQTRAVWKGNEALKLVQELTDLGRYINPLADLKRGKFEVIIDIVAKK